MSLIHLEINNFRNFTNVTLKPEAKFNLIYGNNGSGKTSILEAIHYLSLARSFRTHITNRVINHEQESFSLFGLVQQDSTSIPIGIQRERNNEGQIRIQGKNETSIMELAKVLPLQFINSEAHRLLSGGPKFRRQFLDWGLFHVEQNFLPLWQRAYRALKQRNAALRTLSHEQIRLWNNELANASEELHFLRENYIEKFSAVFLQTLQHLLPNLEVSLSYYRGWSKERALGNILEENISRDIELGYSQFGPQRADLILRSHNIPIQDVLSQGQMKLVVYAMRLAQGMLLKNQSQKNCVYLIDDLPAELDKEKQRLVAYILLNLNTQIFITGIENEDLEVLFPRRESNLFHVEHGGLVKKGRI